MYKWRKTALEKELEKDTLFQLPLESAPSQLSLAFTGAGGFKPWTGYWGRFKMTRMPAVSCAFGSPNSPGDEIGPPHNSSQWFAKGDRDAKNGTEITPDGEVDGWWTMARFVKQGGVGRGSSRAAEIYVICIYMHVYICVLCLHVCDMYGFMWIYVYHVCMYMCVVYMHVLLVCVFAMCMYLLWVCMYVFMCLLHACVYYTCIICALYVCVLYVLNSDRLSIHVL